ncbi:isochorismate synthase [Streptomyces sp. NPDC005438]|uniref:isochorismate synthase n=1 Tax=Streptomyces sp. NPDC005438 TaxID=3156880 RepID=UPI0033A915E0
MSSTAPEVASPPTKGHQTHPAVGTATALLDAYTPGSRFLATPRHTLLTRGVRTHVPHGPAPLAERVAHTLRSVHTDSSLTPLVIGAVPFDQNAPNALVVPEVVSAASPLRADPLISLPPSAAPRHRWNITAHPSEEVYAKNVAELVTRMRSREFDKVVLSRTLELESEERVNLPAMLQRLARRDPTGYTFALPVDQRRTLLGASPELLVSREGNRVVANPLAGSTPRSGDLAEDVRRAAALLDSDKDLHEHAVVVEAVREALGRFCSTLDVPGRPTLTRTATMWHLSTTVTATLDQPSVSALELASALHPTPAVCGTPTDLAREVITDTEGFDRGYFTGMVGWGDAQGDGEWVVTLRCAEVAERSLRLYAGAGIVDASQPRAEVEETEAKFRTFLHAVGVER